LEGRARFPIAQVFVENTSVLVIVVRMNADGQGSFLPARIRVTGGQMQLFLSVSIPVHPWLNTRSFQDLALGAWDFSGCWMLDVGVFYLSSASNVATNGRWSEAIPQFGIVSR